MVHAIKLSIIMIKNIRVINRNNIKYNNVIERIENISKLEYRHKIIK